MVTLSAEAHGKGMYKEAGQEQEVERHRLDEVTSLRLEGKDSRHEG